MSVRTSSVVAVGLVGLTAIGIVTIFGSSLLALTAPAAESRGETSAGPPHPPPAPVGSAVAPDGGASPGVPATTSAGSPTEKAVTKDGS